MYDDDEYDEEEDGEEIGIDQDAADTKKGADDRAFVDQQAKEYDEMKKRKRDELAALKQERLALESKLGAKERVLHALEIKLKRGEYLDMRESIRNERSEVSADERTAREEKADKEIGVIAKDNEYAAIEAEHTELLTEVTALRNSADEIARAVSLLEHDIFRS